jgi:hypothetical protein
VLEFGSTGEPDRIDPEREPSREAQARAPCYRRRPPGQGAGADNGRCSDRFPGYWLAVIDDEDDELDDLPLFQPSCKTGLTPEIAKAVERYLDGKTDQTMRASALVRLGQNIHSIFKRDKS